MSTSVVYGITSHWRNHPRHVPEDNQNGIECLASNIFTFSRSLRTRIRNSSLFGDESRPPFFSKNSSARVRLQSMNSTDAWKLCAGRRSCMPSRMPSAISIFEWAPATLTNGRPSNSRRRGWLAGTGACHQKWSGRSWNTTICITISECDDGTRVDEDDVSRRLAEVRALLALLGLTGLVQRITKCVVNSTISSTMFGFGTRTVSTSNPLAVNCSINWGSLRLENVAIVPNWNRVPVQKCIQPSLFSSALAAALSNRVEDDSAWRAKTGRRTNRPVSMTSRMARHVGETLKSDHFVFIGSWDCEAGGSFNSWIINAIWIANAQTIRVT